MKYKILSAQGMSFLEKEVQQHIEYGWEPVGGVSRGQADSGCVDVWAQAMVLKTTLRTKLNELVNSPTQNYDQ